MEQLSVEVYDFIVELRHKQERAGDKSDTWLEVRQQLSFAEALLRHHLKRGQFKDHPKHIIVIGPTQAGKSSVVNLILGSEAATISPLAGFTRHAQGFTTSHLTDVQTNDIAELLPDWQQSSQQNLSNEQLEAWSLEQATHTLTNTAKSQQHTVIWDTPDFDSVSSRDYRSVVPALCAIADCIVLTVSKEKYADQSVWQLLKMITPLEKPLLICLNKTSQGHDKELRDAMLERLQQENISFCNIVTLPYTTSSLPEQDINNFSKALSDCIPAKYASISADILQSWLQQHWAQWLAPVRAENMALSAWQEMQQQYADSFLNYYKTYYHQESQFSETIQKAVRQLLELLEIPLIAGSLGNVRKVITWPARQLGGLIKRKVVQSRGTENPEKDIILEANRHAWMEMQNKVIHQTQQHLLVSEDNTEDNTENDVESNAKNNMQQWWQQLAAALTNTSQQANTLTETAIDAYQTAFKPEIDKAATQLYEHLQGSPRTLNSLRAARVTTDAAAVIIAIKTAGIGIHDLILTPALLSVTSLLAESAIGSQMKQIEKKLKQRQIVLLKKNLLEQTIAPLFIEITNSLNTENHYHIDAERISTIETLLKFGPEFPDSGISNG